MTKYVVTATCKKSPFDVFYVFETDSLEKAIERASYERERSGEHYRIEIWSDMEEDSCGCMSYNIIEF